MAMFHSHCLIFDSLYLYGEFSVSKPKIQGATARSNRIKLSRDQKTCMRDVERGERFDRIINNNLELVHVCILYDIYVVHK